MPRAKPQFAICLRNDDSDDLEVRKVYRVLPDTKAAAEGYLRVVDESGEDYLYPEEYFVFVEVPRAAERVLAAAPRAD
jgi:hypothetical protein